MKPCIFCGKSADYETYVHEKIKSWVLKPMTPYPMCDDCLPLNKQGDDSKLVDLIISKWKRIQNEREEEKSRVRVLKQEKRLSEVKDDAAKV